MSTHWEHRTKVGRVVYRRKPRFLRSRDVRRIYLGWLKPETQAGSADVELTLISIILDTLVELHARRNPVFRFVRDLIRKLWDWVLGRSDVSAAELELLSDLLSQLSDQATALAAAAESAEPVS